jgi:hypothetical protein
MLTQFFQQLAGAPQQQPSNNQRNGTKPVPFAPAIGGIGQPANAWEGAQKTAQYQAELNRLDQLTPAHKAEQINQVHNVSSISPQNNVAANFGLNSSGTPQTQYAPNDFGVNKPLSQPMFFGYHNDKAIHCGKHLYINC